MGSLAYIGFLYVYVVLTYHLIQNFIPNLVRTSQKKKYEIHYSPFFVSISLLIFLISEDLREYFEKYGEVTNCNLKTDYDTKKSRGFGFVTFAAADSVQKVKSS